MHTLCAHPRRKVSVDLIQHMQAIVGATLRLRNSQMTTASLQTIPAGRMEHSRTFNSYIRPGFCSFVIFKMGKSCTFCTREFSSSSNRLRHEQLFHGKKEDAEDDAESKMDTESENSDDDASQHHVDEWRIVVSNALASYNGEVKDILNEPFLSQFVEHMKNFVEDRVQFVKKMSEDDSYAKIDNMIDRYEEEEDYDRDEAVNTAWHNRRFMLKRIIQENMEDSEESDEDGEVEGEEEAEDEQV